MIGSEPGTAQTRLRIACAELAAQVRRSEQAARRAGRAGRPPAVRFWRTPSLSAAVVRWSPDQTDGASAVQAQRRRVDAERAFIDVAEPDAEALRVDWSRQAPAGGRTALFAAEGLTRLAGRDERCRARKAALLAGRVEQQLTGPALQRPGQSVQNGLAVAQLGPDRVERTGAAGGGPGAQPGGGVGEAAQVVGELDEAAGVDPG